MYAAGSIAAKKEYVVCLYVRLSIEDDDVSGSAFKTESGSITTQRALLHDYIKSRKRTIWQCNAKFKGESKCATPHLYEQRIKELFLEAAGILMEKREEIIGDCRAVMEALADCGFIDTEMETVSSEMEVTAGLIQKLVDENATRKLDQHDYRKKYDGYASRYAALESRMDSLKKERERKEIQYDIFSGFLAGLSETGELPVDFNEKLFHRLVDYATVYSAGRVVFTFRNGVEISTEI